MRYKIVLLMNDLKVAEKMRKMIYNSKLYSGTCAEVIEMSPIREVCDECSRK